MSKMDEVTSIWGIRHYKTSAIPDIIFNRLVHKFGYHYCVCRRFIKLDQCFGVINNDCMMCKECVND